MEDDEWRNEKWRRKGKERRRKNKGRKTQEARRRKRASPWCSMDERSKRWMEIGDYSPNDQ